jgi:hypothetical protein
VAGARVDLVWGNGGAGTIEADGGAGTVIGGFGNGRIADGDAAHIMFGTDAAISRPRPIGWRG